MRDDLCGSGHVVHAYQFRDYFVKRDSLDCVIRLASKTRVMWYNLQKIGFYMTRVQGVGFPDIYSLFFI